MASFIGRQRELRLLGRLLSYKVASLAVIKGRRRVGKSRLIEEFCKNHKTIFISGLPPTKKTTAQHQRDVFAKEMAKSLQSPVFLSNDWRDLFWHLANQTKKGRVIIVLDEISWLGSKDPTFLGKLKNAWDQELKKNDKLILILCGSVSSWIEENIISNTGFLGRIALELTLEELSLPECNEFWGQRQISPHEKFKILSITGGIPRYLEIISPELSAEENIKQLCFEKEGLLFNEFEQIFTDLFARRSGIYKKILICLIKQTHAELDDIFACLGIKKSGVISKYLEDLVHAGFVRRDFTWHLKESKTSKLSRFRISDNYIRFYLKYILQNKDRIERGAFQNRSLSTLPGWENILGLQFENLVLRNRQHVQQILNIDPAEISNDNPYFQRNIAENRGCQIDYLIQTRFNSLYVCEIKFSKTEVKLNVIEDIKNKIKSLILPKNFSYRPVLIHVNGVQDDVIASEYFSKIIDFGELLK